MNRTSSGSRDFKFLLKAVAGSYGELELAFRKGRLSVYYRGNSLAVIVFRPADKYRIDIDERFLDGLAQLPVLAELALDDHESVAPALESPQAEEVQAAAHV